MTIRINKYIHTDIYLYMCILLNKHTSKLMHIHLCYILFKLQDLYYDCHTPSPLPSLLFQQSASLGPRPHSIMEGGEGQTTEADESIDELLNNIFHHGIYSKHMYFNIMSNCGCMYSTCTCTCMGTSFTTKYICTLHCLKRECRHIKVPKFRICKLKKGLVTRAQCENSNKP